MKRPLYFLFLAIFALSACATTKRQNTRLTLPEPIPPEVKEVYACSFELSTFEGILPCFGNDCTDAGAPLTTLKFNKDQELVKYLESENGQRDTVSGQWHIGTDCIIQIQYGNSKKEFFKFHSALQKVELLNLNQKSFPGILNKHYFISKIK